MTLFRRFGFLIILLLLSLAGVTGASLESPIQLGERCLICQSCGHQVEEMPRVCRVTMPIQQMAGDSFNEVAGFHSRLKVPAQTQCLTVLLI